MATVRAEHDSPATMSDRVSSLLAAFDDGRRSALARIARQANLPRSSVHRILQRQPQIAARGYFEGIDHPVAGRIPVLPFRFGRIRRWSRLAPAIVGQHSSEVLAKELGLSR